MYLLDGELRHVALALSLYTNELGNLDDVKCSHGCVTLLLVLQLESILRTGVSCLTERHVALHCVSIRMNLEYLAAVNFSLLLHVYFHCNSWWS